jgi:hypothetical protein
VVDGEGEAAVGDLGSVLLGSFSQPTRVSGGGNWFFKIGEVVLTLKTNYPLPKPGWERGGGSPVLVMEFASIDFVEEFVVARANGFPESPGWRQIEVWVWRFVESEDGEQGPGLKVR